MLWPPHSTSRSISCEHLPIDRRGMLCPGPHRLQTSDEGTSVRNGISTSKIIGDERYPEFHFSSIAEYWDDDGQEIYVHIYIPPSTRS